MTASGRAGGPAVMPAHGLGCDQSTGRSAAPLAERDSTGALFDRAGAGRPDPPAWSRDRCAALEDRTEDVPEVCREPALGPVTFAADPVSAMTGLPAAARRPGAFCGPVPLAPSPRRTDDPAAGRRGGSGAEDTAAASTDLATAPR